MKKVEITDNSGNKNGAAIPNIKIPLYKSKLFLFIKI